MKEMNWQKPVIRLHEVRVPGREKPFNFEVFKGETVVISGGRGAEKRLLGHVVLGLMAPESGTVELLGKDVTTLPRQELLKIRTRCAVVPEGVSLISNLNVTSNIALPLRFHTLMPEPEIAKRVDDALKRHGLSQIADLRPAALDTAQQRFVAMIRSLLIKPAVIILEEPFDGLNETAIEKLREMVDGAVVGGSAVLVTTDNTRLETTFDGQLLKLRSGRVHSIAME